MALDTITDKKKDNNNKEEGYLLFVYSSNIYTECYTSDIMSKCSYKFKYNKIRIGLDN